jgi:hypothetical protein
VRPVTLDVIRASRAPLVEAGVILGDSTR